MQSCGCTRCLSAVHVSTVTPCLELTDFRRLSWLSITVRHVFRYSAQGKGQRARQHPERVLTGLAPDLHEGVQVSRVVLVLLRHREDGMEFGPVYSRLPVLKRGACHHRLEDMIGFDVAVCVEEAQLEILLLVITGILVSLQL